jgi:DnaJ domain
MACPRPCAYKWFYNLNDLDSAKSLCGAAWIRGAGAGSKEKAKNKPSPRRAKMTVDDARDILGVKAGATLDEIRTAYLNLMSKVHPDHGGSNYFAKELNAAREILLGL